ncbi:MAG: DUF3482 domain-containing protein [Burkholderiaceae bacterium]
MPWHPFCGGRASALAKTSVLMRQHKGTLQTVLADLDRQAAERRAASAQRVADTLISAAAMRREIEPETLANPNAKSRFVAEFRGELVANVRRCVDDLLQMHGFDKHDAQLDVMQWTSGRWESDLFNPETLASVGRLLGKGAAAGAAVGFTLDLALAGMSLGAATALGAAIGGAFGSGGGVRRRASCATPCWASRSLTLDNDVLIVLADSLVQLCQTLQARGHAAQDPIAVRMAPAGDYRQALLQLLELLNQARAHPEWEHHAGSRRNHSTRREALGQTSFATRVGRR